MDGSLIQISGSAISIAEFGLKKNWNYILNETKIPLI
jgi:hypothetical protein